MTTLDQDAPQPRGNCWPYVAASSIFCATYPILMRLFSRTHWGIAYGQDGLAHSPDPKRAEAALYVLGGIGLLKVLAPVCGLVFAVWGWRRAQPTLPSFILAIVAVLMLGNALFILE